MLKAGELGRWSERLLCWACYCIKIWLLWLQSPACVSSCSLTHAGKAWGVGSSQNSEMHGFLLLKADFFPSSPLRIHFVSEITHLGRG